MCSIVVRKMKLNPYLAVILAATIGGSSGVFIKLLDLPPTTMTFFRVFVPTVVVLSYILLVKKTKLIRGNWKMMLLASGLNAVRMFLYFVAYLYTTLGNAVIMSQTWPIFAVILSILILKEKPTMKTLLLIGLAFLGIIIMLLNKEISFANKEWLGMLIMMISGLGYAGTAIIFKKELTNYSKTETIFYQNIVGAVVFLPFIFINQPLPATVQGSIATIYGFSVGVIAFLLFFYAMKKLPMSHFALFSYWEIIATVIFGVVFFHEQITFSLLMGGSMIVLAGLLLRKDEHKDREVVVE